MSLTSYQAAPPRNLASPTGGAGGSRTHNPQIRSLMLYPVELQPQEPKTARIILFFFSPRKGASELEVPPLGNAAEPSRLFLAV